MGEEKMFEVIQLLGDFVTRVDNTNKRLIRALLISVVAFAATITICFTVLYTSEYEVTSMQQQQMDSSGQQQQSGNGTQQQQLR